MSAVVGRLTLGACFAFALLACESDVEPDLDAGDEPASDGGISASDGDVEAGEPYECNSEPVRECPDPPPRYADVAPIFEQRCAGCHVDNWSGPWPLDTYQHVADWASVIRDMVRTCTMPPPEAGTPLPNDDAQKILTWIFCKTPK